VIENAISWEGVMCGKNAAFRGSARTGFFPVDEDEGESNIRRMPSGCGTHP